MNQERNFFMSNYNFSYLTTRELLEKALNGELPIPRNNPKFGESKYFFMKTGDDPYASINDAEVFDVPDDEDPFVFRDNGYQSSALNSNSLSSTIDTPSLSTSSLNTSWDSNRLTNSLETDSFSNTFSQSNTSMPDIAPNESVMDYLRKLFPLESSNDTEQPIENNAFSISPTTPYNTMREQLITPLQQNVIDSSNSLFSSKTAFAQTETQPDGNLETEIRLPTNEELNPVLSRHFKALGEYEGTKEKIYFDEGGLATVGKGTRITPERIRSGFFDGYVVPEDREKFITALELTEQSFKNGLINKYPTYTNQIELFDRISKGKPVENLNLNGAELGAISHLFSYTALPEQMDQFVQKFYEEEGYDRLRNFLNFKKINYNDLPMGMQEILLDISYNPGKSSPMYIKENVDGTVSERSSWNKLGDHLANKEYYKALSEIFRNVQDSRNNYLFLRGMQDFGYLKDEDLIKIVDQLTREQLAAKRSGKSYLKRVNKNNYPIYQKRYNLPLIGPF